MTRSAEPMAGHPSETVPSAGGPSATGPGALPGARTGAGDRADGGRRRTRLRRRLLPVALALVLTLVAGCGSLYLYYRHLNGNLHAGSNNLSDAQGARSAPNAAGQTPLNILLIGTDSRGSAADVALGGSSADADRPGLADVQMLLHISADRQNASMISIPRDTMVAMPACHSEDGKQDYPAQKRIQINEALARGGPGCVVGTWIALTGLAIDHYMMVDFAGVVTMADAVGGVPVCVTMNMYDRQIPGVGGTGLKVPAGTHPLKGQDALQWLRVRDAWGSDLGRTKAQHLYLASLMRQLKSNGSLTDPGELMRLAEAATRSLSVDHSIADVRKLYDLGDELKSIPAERTTTLTVPTLEDPKDTNRVVMQEPDTGDIWKMLLTDTPLDGKGRAAAGASPTASPTGAATPSAEAPQGPARDGIAVTVQNATGGPNRATEVRDALAGAGFTQAATVATGGTRAATTLTYGSGRLPQAQAVAAALGLPDSALRPAGESTALALVVGSDWPGGTTFGAAGTPTAGAAPTALPTSVTADTAADDRNCMDVVPQHGRYTY